MAEILTQRALVLAEIEVTFGVDPVPTPADDALLVDEPDFTVDLTIIERNFARDSLSPLPIAAGRKIATMTFTREVRSNGLTATPNRVGKLLRGCGLAETQILVNGTAVNGRADVTADSGNTGATITWAAQGTEALIQDASYRIRTVISGITAVAAVRVTGGVKNPTDAALSDEIVDATQEADAIPTETFGFEKVSYSGPAAETIVVDDATDPLAVTYDLTALTGLVAGDTFRVTIAGLPFFITLGATATPTGLGDDIVTAITAHPDIAPVNAIGVVTMTLSGRLGGVVLTSATTVLPLGVSGLSIVPTWAATLDLNDAHTAITKPVGHEYSPISTAFESVTIYMYFDGILHRLTASRGTFSVEGTGGELATFSFEFTGNFNTVTDAALPSATFETQIPVQVELAQLIVNPFIDETLGTPPTSLTGDNFDFDGWEDIVNGQVDVLCAGSFSFDMANVITPRACINEADAFKGVIITGRAPVGTIDPELELVATHDFWNILATADVLSWQIRIGTTRGNVVRFESDAVQYSGLSYEDRDGIRTLAVDLRFSGTAPNFSNDEILIAFN